MNLARARFTGATNTSSFGINSFLQGSANSRRSRYSVLPRTYREAPLATPQCDLPVDDDEDDAWEPEDEIDLEFNAIDESTTEMPAHADFNSLGVRVREVGDDDDDNDYENEHGNGNDDDDYDGETDSDTTVLKQHATHLRVSSHETHESAAEATQAEPKRNKSEAMGTEDGEHDTEQVPVNALHKEYADVPGPQSTVPLDDFHLAVMVFMTSTDMSTDQYRAFVEVMSFATIESIRTLPKSISTLKDRCRRHMPLARLRKHSLPINTDKVPPKSENPKNAYRFEVEEYARLWLADRKLLKDMHFGMGLVEQHRKEFWHGDSWLGSIRSTSGQFAWLANCEEPLLPSDCVSYMDGNGRSVILRVHGVGTSPDEQQVIIGKRLIEPGVLPGVFQWPNCLQSIPTQNPRFQLASSELPELILMEDDRMIIPVSRLLKKEWVHFLDYPDECDLTDTLLPNKPSHCVRYIAYMKGDVAKVRGVHQRHRIPAELELADMGRTRSISSFVSTPTGPKHISVPFTLFLDDFGLYRNAYHSLAGLYIQPACLNESGRFTLQNMFVLMIGPFGCTVSDMVTGLQDETVNLGKGISTTIDDSPVILTAFPICIMGDMPQQNKNCGVMSHRSRKGCRMCYVDESARGNLDYDTSEDGRYLEPSRQLLNHIRATNTTAKDRDAARSARGITEEGHIFGRAFTGLNPFTGYPSDPMHCELRLAKYFQTMLVEDVLSVTGIAAYQQAWNNMNVPYG